MQETETIFHISSDQLMDDLRVLCAQPSSTGHVDELKATARIVADMLRRIGLFVNVVQTDGAPVVVAWREGQFASRLLLYHHYDVAPTGPWYAWFHEPFQLAERNRAVYGRGVAHGKGALVAHIQALRALLQRKEDLACGLALVIEGEGLQGSPHLAGVINEYAAHLTADACLSTGGERDAHERPLCYGGSKGLLRVRLSARGPGHPLAPGMAASIPNPVWRLTWALNHIKGEDEDIRINGFYDAIAGPGQGEREMLRKIALDEQGRLEAWQVPSFLFGMSGAALARSEVTLPTCNISSFAVEPHGNISSVPVAASALVDFQLVPDQQPDAVLALLQKHLADRGCGDIVVEALPGSYAPVRNTVDHPFIQQLLESGERIYGEPPGLLPIGAFAQPLHILADALHVPVAALALARQNSALYGPNEHLPLEDLVRHGQVLAELLLNYNGQQTQTNAPS